LNRCYSKILVTGGAGFIGSHIVDRLLDEGFNVRVFDNLSTGDKKNLVQHKSKGNLQFIEGDIRNFDLVKKAVKGVDAIFHEAALVSVTRSVEDPLLANEVNVTGTLNLLKACVDAKVKRFVFASSCAVYGSSKTLPNHENLMPMPLSPYAVSKLAAENYVKVFHVVYGLETVILRYFNVYGPRQKYGPYSGVISIFVKRLLDGRPLTIYGDGKQSRDFVNVKDVVEANMLALLKQNAVGEVINISAGEAITINALINSLQKIIDKTDFELFYTETRLGDIKNSFADIKKAKKILGYIPKVSISEGLVNLVNWYANEFPDVVNPKASQSRSA
jgi:nucleoside-diphosphate-sugar epimerase